MSSASDPSSPERGFTLLEAMCAFAILALVTGFTTQIFVQSVDKGTTALSRRELREAADTLFRKMIYESHRYKDGDSKTLDQEFAQLYGGRSKGPRGFALDRWGIYFYELEKKEKNVAGALDPDSSVDSLFGEDDGEGTQSTSTTGGTTTGGTTTGGSTGAGGTATEGEGGPTGLTLLHMVMKIYRTDEREDPLLTLSAWIKKPPTAEGR